MKTRIEVANRKEAELIRAGLEDVETRALVKVMGALFKLPSKRAKARTLLFVVDSLDEAAHAQTATEPKDHAP